MQFYLYFYAILFVNLKSHAIIEFMKWDDIPSPEIIFTQTFGFCEDSAIDIAIKSLAHSLRPNSIILLTGPTGTGKGELAKAIADTYAEPWIDFVEFALGEVGENLKEEGDIEKIIEKIKRYCEFYHRDNLHIGIERFVGEFRYFLLHNNILKKNNLEMWNFLFSEGWNFWQERIKFIDKGIDFRKINLSAYTRNEELAYSELFGHKKGSFTGATSDRNGKLANSTERTVVFMDELNRASLTIQAKLLDFTENFEFIKFGAKEGEKEKFNGLLIFAINEDPKKAISERRLLEDLYYRIEENEFRLPSLQEHINHHDRPEEILEFIAGVVHTKLLKKYNTCPVFGKECDVFKLDKRLWGAPPLTINLLEHISEECRKFISGNLESGVFRGNLRELGHLVERLMNYPVELQHEDLISGFSSKNAGNEFLSEEIFSKKWKEARNEFEEKYFEYNLQKNRKLTYEELSQKLGVSKETIRKFKKRHKIN